MKKILKILKYILNHPIGKRKPFLALSRFFYWQFISRLNFTKKDFYFQFVNHTKLYINKHQTVATGNYYVGLMEFSEMCFTAHFLTEQDTFFDIGANIGTYTVIASGICNAITYAFEPIPQTFYWLKKNIELNNIQNKVIALNIGVADKNDFLYFTNNLYSKNHVVSPIENKHIIKVPVRKLNEFENLNPKLMKIDVEGYELYILKGANQILEQENLKAIIIEVNHEMERYNISNNTIHNLLSSYGFKMYKYDPFNRELIKISKQDSDNILYIRDIEYVTSQIKKASKIKVWGIYI